MLLLIDHHDSFTHNLEHLLREQGLEVRTCRPEDLPPGESVVEDHVGLVLSPGPGDPAAARTSLDLLARWPSSRPVLGICLGMQILALQAGARIARLPRPRHGRPSPLHHDEEGLFRGLPSPTEVMRYHSLHVEMEGLPAQLVPTGWTEDAPGARILMGLRFAGRPWHGLQFHPESFLSPEGSRMIASFCEEFEA